MIVPTIDPTSAGDTVLRRCDALAALSEDDGRLTRTYLTSRHAEANALVGDWMRAAGLDVRIDALGNLVGRYEAATPEAPAVILGSHLDTVRDAGRYDGILGVLSGLAVVEALARAGRRLPFAIEVVGFGDEEGVRFGATLIGSRGMAGTLDPALLEAADGNGVSLSGALAAFGLDPARWREAARRPEDVRAYLEVHIEQGPRLESLDAPLGVVTAIAGASRRAVTLTGMAGHAGTVPMEARRDALAGAAEALLAIEAIGRDYQVVATVGRIEAFPGAVNVIPGQARFTIDLRAADDRTRAIALIDLEDRLARLAARRGLGLAQETLHETPATPCDPHMTQALAHAIERAGLPVHRLMSGAGHDAMAMASLAPVGMLFVRCAGGVSHNPAESITADDAGQGVAVLLDTLLLLAEDPSA